uniref:Uncharacterized protein n=1 Tax=Anguilla anguilla TaxID=7936 RepID=A0A0E9P7X2_ANGAN
MELFNNVITRLAYS